LKELKEKKLFVAIGYRTFDALLAARVPIGRSQAYKLIAIAERVTREQAISLGEEKAYAIARLVATTPEADTVGECQSSCRFLLIPYEVARDSAPSMVS
jgi:hypothetical protein